MQSVRRSVARARSACWIASSSAWAVGSRRETDSLWVRATTTPSRNTAAPTGTSPAHAARRASSSAAAMPARSAADGLGTHRLGGRRRDALERQVGPVLGPLDPHPVPLGVLAFGHGERERVLEQPLDGALQRPRPVHRVVSVGDDPLLRGRRHVQAEFAISHELREPRNLQVHDLPDVVARKRPENDRIVHAVQELGAERLAQQLEHLGLHLLPVLGAHLEDVRRPDVRRHDEHGVPEIDRATLGVGEAPLVEDLQQHVEDIGVRLLDLVEQHHGVRPAADRLRQLAALLVADVAGRRADHPRHRVLFHVLRHVEPHQGLLVVEEELAELRERSKVMKAQWQAEKETIGGLQAKKAQLEQLRTEADQATRRGDLQRAAEITYGRIPAIEREIGETEKRLADVQKKGKYLKEEVDAEDIAEIVAKWTGIPVSRMLESERERLTRLEAELGRRVIGQPEALAAVSNAVRRARAGLQDPNRPTGSFIFLGPTGVGKTETARALAEFLFDDEKALVRLDMSEYMEKHAVARMIGAPPGYVGYEEGGQLTEAIRRRPYAVVLFDEIEKAHPDVFNVLLQILDEGRLTDSQGRTVDFRNTVLIMTSNIGSPYILEMGTENWEQVETKVLELLRQTFRPEFLNRVDDTIIFRPLSSDDIGKIVDLQIARFAQLMADRKLGLEVTPAAKQLIVADGYDPVYGARPLKRAIQRLLQNPLALAVLEGQYAEGDTVRVDRAKDGTRLTFERVTAGAAEPARA